MIEKIRSYIDRAFESAPQTKKILELKEELYANLVDKYHDQLDKGASEQDAYNTVISGIGDIYELIDSVNDPQPLAPPTARERSRSALLVSIAVGLYIISPFTLIFSTVTFSAPIPGLFFMFLCIAVATGLLIYNNMTRKTYVKQEDTIVEDFKEWRVKTDKHRAALRSFHGAFWSSVVAVYLLVSFLFGIWAYSWIIFIIAAALDNILKGIFQLRGGDDDA